MQTLGTTLGLEEKRIQFTPDLMPADIVGSEVLEEHEGRRAFRFIGGPVFCQLLMADEINRASPRTQSALLQAMQEKHVTVAGERYDLPEPFHVLATQNPLEQEGHLSAPRSAARPLPAADRCRLSGRAAERRMLLATTGVETQSPKQVISAEQLLQAQYLIRQVPVGESVVEAILRLVRSARPDTPEASPEITKFVAWGPGPRASQAFMLAVRARALLGGRLAPSIDDVAALRWSRPSPPHGTFLLGARRRRDPRIDHPPADGEARVSDARAAGANGAQEERKSGRWTPMREEAARLSSALPPLLVDAERIAATVAQGVHGRRRVGPGETFWQFPPLPPSATPRTISTGGAPPGRSTFFVRETEWEAAQSVWLWRDGSASMDFSSSGGVPTKLHRAGVLGLALAMLLIQAGERIAALGESHPPQAGRAPLSRLAYLYGPAWRPRGIASRSSAASALRAHGVAVGFSVRYRPAPRTHARPLWRRRHRPPPPDPRSGGSGLWL